MSSAKMEELAWILVHHSVVSVLMDILVPYVKQVNMFEVRSLNQ